MTIGILSFGTLLEDPGAELASAVQRIEDVETPFQVEFARSAITRDGAPTLVPVTTGGAAVGASVLVLKDGLDEEAARDILYRREMWQVGMESTYEDAHSAWIGALCDFHDVDVCIYTALEPTIEPLTPERLADLAIESAAGEAGVHRRDGISYLEGQKRRGVETPLMPAYEAQVLLKTDAASLADAWARARAG